MIRCPGLLAGTSGLSLAFPGPAWHVGQRSLIGAPNQFAWLRWDLEFGIWGFPRSGLFGGVPDSTLGWIVSLLVEDEGWPRKSSFKKIIGNYEEMPLAA